MSKIGKTLAVDGFEALPNNSPLGKVGKLGKDLKVGDRVRYSGADKTCQRQYTGVLTIREMKGDAYACLKSCGSGLTSWIEGEDLAVAA